MKKASFLLLFLLIHKLCFCDIKQNYQILTDFLRVQKLLLSHFQGKIVIYIG